MQQRRQRRSRAFAMAALVGMAALAGLSVLAGPRLANFPESPPPEPAPWSRLEVTPAYRWHGPHLAAGTAYRDALVFVGGDAVWSVTSDSTWPEIEASAGRIDGAFLVGIATDGAQLVAIGATGQVDDPGLAVWTSPDGRAWRSVGEPPAFALHKFLAIDGSSSGFLLRTDAADGRTELFTSRDAVAWQLVDGRQFGDGSPSDVAPYRGGWLAVGSGPSRNGNQIPPNFPGRAWWSADGITWNRASISDRHGLATVLTGAAGALAVGSADSPFNTDLYRSVDGRSWSGATRDPIPHPASYVSDGRRIVRWAWQDDNSIAWSSNGTEWHVVDAPLDSGLSGRFYLGTASLVLDFEVVTDSNTPAEPFLQLLRAS